MKKIVVTSMLVISLITNAQTFKNDQPDDTAFFNDISVDLMIQNLPSNVIEEEDAPFDFNINDYLPIGFNPYNKDQYKNIAEVITEEKDAPFDFDTKSYLPVRFNPYKGMVSGEESTL